MRTALHGIIDEFLTQFVFDNDIDKIAELANKVDEIDRMQRNGFPCRAGDCDKKFCNNFLRVR